MKIKIIQMLFAIVCAVVFISGGAFALNMPEQGGASAAKVAQAQHKVTLKIMTINVRHNMDFWEERFPLIADEIVRLKPDLIGFQEMEVDINQSKTLLDLIAKRVGPDGLKYEKYDHLKTGGDMIWGEGISIFSRYPIEKKEFADLGHGRIVLHERIKVADGLSVDFYNTHLHNEGGDKITVPQAQKIAEFAEKNDAGFPIFLTGDMNSIEGSRTIDYYTANSFIDTYRAFHGAETAVTGNTSTVILSKKNVQQNFTERIDFIFMKVPEDWEDQMKIIDSVVCFKNHDEQGLYPSDHLGVITTFEITY